MSMSFFLVGFGLLNQNFIKIQYRLLENISFVVVLHVLIPISTVIVAHSYAIRTS